MMRMPRIVSSLALACCLSGPLSLVCFAQDANTPPAAAADQTGGAMAISPDMGDDFTGEQPAAPTLTDLVDTYWHYGKIARYDLAADAGQKILEMKKDPRQVLEAFETVAGRRGDMIDNWMLRWRSLPVPGDSAADDAMINRMRTISDKLNTIINQGYATRSSDPTYIRSTIEEMSHGQRAYDNNLPRLQRSGELAVKVLVDILRNPNDSIYHAVARRALRDLGRKALSPLLAATEMRDVGPLVDIITALGDIGYDASIPYLARLEQDQSLPETVHAAARNALLHIGVPDASSLHPADEFFNLAEKLYYGKSSIEPSGDQVAFIWFWTNDRGLTKRNVPTAIFADCMAMRACEYALKIDPSKGEAVSLWLDADTRREVDMPPGGDDPTHRGDPDAHYYDVSAGVKYLDAALARALNDREAALSFRLTQSLQDIVGQSNITASEGDPLLQALYFPNRLVRYEAAFALADSLPTQQFPGSDRVVPLLVEALAESGKPHVLVVAPAQGDELAHIRQAVQSLGYEVAAAEDPNAGAARAMELPAVDLIVISDDADVPQMIDLEQSNAKLQGASMLVLTKVPGSVYATRSATDPLMNAVVMPPAKNLAKTLKLEIQHAREHAGVAAMTEQQASNYALRAANLLVKLALSQNQVLNLAPAEGGVLTALSDPRPQIAEAAGRVLGMLQTASAQNGLAMKAIDEHTPSEVRVSLFKSLANNAKFFGNSLDATQAAGLERVVAFSKDAAVRDAAAEARGALNLPADEARSLIIAQSRV